MTNFMCYMYSAIINKLYSFSQNANTLTSNHINFIQVFNSVNSTQLKPNKPNQRKWFGFTNTEYTMNVIYKKPYYINMTWYINRSNRINRSKPNKPIN